MIAGAPGRWLPSSPPTAMSIDVNSDGEENLVEEEEEGEELTRRVPGRKGSARLGRKWRNPEL